MCGCGKGRKSVRTTSSASTKSTEITSIQPSNGRTEILYYRGETYSEHLVEAGVNTGYRLVNSQVNVYLDASEKLKALVDEDGNPYFLNSETFAEWYANGKSFETAEEVAEVATDESVKEEVIAEPETAELVEESTESKEVQSEPVELDTVENNTEEAIDYSKMLKAELVEIAQSKGFDTSGLLKADLVKLLTE